MQVWLLLLVFVPPLKDVSFLLCFSPRTTEVPVPDRICHCLHGRHSVTQMRSHWGTYANSTLAEEPTRPDASPRRPPSGSLALRCIADQQTSARGHRNLSMLGPEPSQLKNGKWSRSQNFIRYCSALYFFQNYSL